MYQEEEWCTDDDTSSADSIDFLFDTFEFDGSDSGIHPLDFIEQYEELCDTQYYRDMERLNKFKRCFKGDAKQWYRMHQFSFYQEAKEAFIEVFWGPKAQERLCERLYNGRYEKSLNISRASYARNWADQTRYLEPPMDDAEFIGAIRHHFGKHISRQLMPQYAQTMEDLMYILESVDQEESAKQGKRRKRKRNNAARRKAQQFKHQEQDGRQTAQHNTHSEVGSIRTRSDLMHFDIMNKFRNLCSPGIGCIKNFEYDIKLKRYMTFQPETTYPITEKYFETVKTYLYELEQEGIVRKLATQYINPLVVTPKKNGSIRLCLDARALNNLIKNENTKPITIDEVLQRIGRNKVFSALDVANALWQVSLSPRSQELVGFRFDEESYVFCRMPFGLKTGASVLTRAITQILGPNLSDHVVVYADDILITGRRYQQHDQILNEVLGKLEEGGVKLNKDKCRLHCTEIDFLGHKISERKVSMLEETIQKVEAFPRPDCRKALQKFLGLISSSRRFISDLSELTGPLEALLKKNSKFLWTQELEENFVEIKKQFRESEGLFLAVAGLSYGICAYGDKYSISARLFQYRTDDTELGIPKCFYKPSTSRSTGTAHESGEATNAYKLYRSGVTRKVGNENDVLDELSISEEFTISFASRSLKCNEIQYSEVERGSLAIVWALKKWYSILCDQKVYIRYMHEPLEYLTSTASHNARNASWLDILRNFDIVDTVMSD